MEKIIEKALQKYNIRIDNNKHKQLSCFIEEMKKYNEHTNITAITDNHEIIYKHILDCLLPLNKIKNNSKVLDIGCGAGFPSIPLAIANENVKITAIDSVNKKIKFVNQIINQLKLKNITAQHTRIEEFLNKLEFREQFDIVVSRAVAPLNIVIEYSAPALKNGGIIIAYKGSNYNEEIKIAENAMHILDCKVIEVEDYYIEEINAERHVVIIRKNSKIPAKYPRVQNKPRTQPL